LNDEVRAVLEEGLKELGWDVPVEMQDRMEDRERAELVKKNNEWLKTNTWKFCLEKLVTHWRSLGSRAKITAPGCCKCSNCRRRRWRFSTGIIARDVQEIRAREKRLREEGKILALKPNPPFADVVEDVFEFRY
jgi:hypothetical protein